MANGNGSRLLGGTQLARYAMAARAGAAAPAGSSPEFRAAWDKLAAGSSIALNPSGGWIQFAPEQPSGILPPVTRPATGWTVPESSRNPVPIPGVPENPMPNNIPIGPTIPGVDSPLPGNWGPAQSQYGPGGGIYNPIRPPLSTGVGVLDRVVGRTHEILRNLGITGGSTAWGDVARVAAAANPPASTPAGSAPAGGMSPAGSPPLSFASALDPKNLLKYGGILFVAYILYNVGKSNSAPYPRARRRPARRRRRK